MSKYYTVAMIMWQNDKIYERKHVISTDSLHRQTTIRQQSHSDGMPIYHCPLEQRSRRNANVGATSAVDRDGADQCRRWANVTMLAGMLKTRRPNGRLIFNMEIAIRR